jgi:thymidylate synthase (FAD)
MRIVDLDIDFIEQRPGIQGMFDQIEIGARTCYKSEGLIKYDDKGNSLTSKEFVNKIVKVYKHESVAEHGTVYLKIPNESEFAEEIAFFCDNHYSELIKIGKDGNYVITNYRVLLEHHKEYLLDYFTDEIPKTDLNHRLSIRFTCQLIIDREINRHRCHSISGESTRFCNYSKDKFGNNISICKPKFIEDEPDKDKLNNISESTSSNILASYIQDIFNHTTNWTKVDYWIFANLAAEFSYLNLLRLGTKTDAARTVLPVDVKSEIVHTASYAQWRDFVKLRTSDHAHPDVRPLAFKVKEYLINNGIYTEEDFE